MTASLTRLRGRKPVRWTTILGLVLVPLTVAGVLLWGLWNPTERLDTVTAAVVNADEPVELDGQLVPLGRVLAAELIAGDEDTNFTWVLTDAEDAEAGISDGRFATSVTIPENFSAAATSANAGPEKIETAHIDIAESTQGRLIDTALSNIVTQTATTVLNRELGEQFIGTVFVGMNELHRGLSDAADGANKLADGGDQLASGATGLADGTRQLADGTQQLAGGAGELAGGAGSLASGASSLSDGAAQLASGLRLFVSGDGTAANPGLNGFASGMRVFATGDGTGTGQNAGLAGLATGVEQYTGGVNQALDGITTGIGELRATRDGIAAGTIPLPPGTDPAVVVGLLDQVIAGLDESGALGQIDALKAGGTQLAVGARQAANGANELANGAAGIAAGGEQLAVGAEGLAGGAASLSGGASQLAGGASELAGGASELAAGTPALADGASQLADGARRSADGTHSLAKGLGEAVSGIPNYTEAERDRLASHAVQTVEARGGSDELFNSSGVPLFAGIALWAGALAMFLMLAPLWSRTRDAARGVGYITLRSALPAIGVGAVQGAIAGVVLPIALGYSVGQFAAFFGLALLAGITFSLVVQGLSALLGGVGRFVAFALLVVAFAVGIVSTVPGPLAAVGDASPIGAALSGFQAVASGASGAGIAAVLLALWGGLGLALTALAVGRARKAR
ncbi:YhgE/Pip family protein [Leucobacter luti]|uniref:YhgE/Pip family protein n=1 Tax=Leucobacter luti TaxID=340320 RepID=UPI003D07DE03